MIHVLVVLGFYSNVCGARRILYLPTEALSNFSYLYFQRSFSFILIILLAHVESFTSNQIIEQTGRNIFLVYYLFTCSSLCHHQNQLAV